jgi:hypothetical protein
MWKVRETPRIGVKTLWEVYRIDSKGETIVRGRWAYRKEAVELADKLNKEETSK